MYAARRSLRQQKRPPAARYFVPFHKRGAFQCGCAAMLLLEHTGERCAYCQNNDCSDRCDDRADQKPAPIGSGKAFQIAVSGCAEGKHNQKNEAYDRNCEKKLKAEITPRRDRPILIRKILRIIIAHRIPSILNNSIILSSNFRCISKVLKVSKQALTTYAQTLSSSRRITAG